MTKHTPAQIEEYNPVDGQFFIEKDKQGKMIAKAFDLQNARLIAAAPDLLEALKEALIDLENFKVADDVCEEHPIIIQARAAIAKAEGK